VSFDDLADFLQFGLPLPGRPVILSFDDGWQNQFDYAFPLLKKYDFTATFFVATGYLEHQNFMTIQQLQTLMGAGMTIGSHTCSHVALSTTDSPSMLQEELAGSKAWLEKRLSVPINNFAYPYGSYSATVASAVEASGYRTARTFDIGAHYTRSRLATLPGTLFKTYADRYRYVAELAAATPR
jgi:peptidoglycan/xylan/chitin deacetylase (PgdA/CDA1 family)